MVGDIKGMGLWKGGRGGVCGVEGMGLWSGGSSNGLNHINQLDLIFKFFR